MSIFEIMGELIVLSHVVSVSPMFGQGSNTFSVKVVGKDSSLVFKFTNTNEANKVRNDLISAIKEAK